MSIESTLERIAVALEIIANNQSGVNNEAKKSAKKASPVVEQLATAQAVPVIPVAQPEPEAIPVPVVPAPVLVAPVVPDFMGTAATPTVTCPISDQKGLLAYVMSAYQEMGATKGALIQDILSRIGAAHLNDVKPEHYPTIYAGVEALKAQ
jgi:hypothetical protein